MRDNIIIGLLAVTLIMTGVNTYLISKDDSVPNLTPEKGETTDNSLNQAKTNNASSNGANQQLSTSTKTPNSSINNMSGNENATSMKFEKSLHDFGSVKSTSENKYNFQFTNTGDAPLVISNARGSCGCTVPNYPKTPIAPGETGEIEVIYSPKNQSGPQTKTVTITANTQPASTVLTIKADVSEG